MEKDAIHTFQKSYAVRHTTAGAQSAAPSQTPPVPALDERADVRLGQPALHRMSKLPDLEAWAIFAKVAELGSFAKAAAELSVSQATVSKAISRLEARVNTTLFHRTTRQMTLTTGGQAALERAARILEEGEAVEAEAAAQSVRVSGLVRLAAPMSFGIARLAPILPEFMAAHPDVELDVQLSDELVALLAGRFDLALRIARLGDSSLRARRLCSVRIVLVASPAYFKRHGRPTHPRDLQAHRALVYSYAANAGTWRFRHARHGDFSQVVPASLRSNNAEVFMPALSAGLGMALQPEFLVWQALRDGTLESVLPAWQVEPIALHIVSPPGRQRPARVQALVDFLAGRLAQEPWARQEGLSAVR